MKKKKFELEWFVYVHGVNCNGFRKMNIFNHFRFEEDTIKHLKECSIKEEFADVNVNIKMLYSISMWTFTSWTGKKIKNSKSTFYMRLKKYFLEEGI